MFHKGKVEAMVVRSIDYKKFVCTGSVMQSSYWAAVKHGTGWKPYAFEVEDEERQFSLLVLVKQVLPFWQLAYIPFAPEQSSQTGELLKQLAKALRKKLPSSVFALRYDLPFDEVNDQNVMLYNGPRFRTCRESVQPEGTVRIDLHWGYQAVTKGYRDRAKRALRKASQVFEWASGAAMVLRSSVGTKSIWKLPSVTGSPHGRKNISKRSCPWMARWPAMWSANSCLLQKNAR